MRRVSGGNSFAVDFKGCASIRNWSLDKFFQLHLLPVLLVVLIALSSNFAGAAEIKVTPKIAVAGSYDDNITFTPNNELSSSIVTVSPGVNVDYETLLSKVLLTADLHIQRYLDESDLDRTDQYYRLSGSHRFQERLNGSGGLRFYRDTTLNTYLQETGRVIQRVQRDYLNAFGKVSYDLTMLSGISARYDFRNVTYDSSVYSDYDKHTADLYFYHHLKNQRDTFTLGPSYSYRSDDQNDIDSGSLDFGWIREWSEVTHSDATIGPRYTHVKNTDGTTKDNWGAKAAVNITTKGEVSSTGFHYFHDLRTTVDGEDINVDNFFLTYNRLITERFGVGFYGRLIFSYKMYSNQQNINDERLYWLQPRMFYKLTKDLELSFEYRYQNSVESLDSGDVTRERNTVMLQLSYGLPFLL